MGAGVGRRARLSCNVWVEHEIRIIWYAMPARCACTWAWLPESHKRARCARIARHDLHNILVVKRYARRRTTYPSSSVNGFSPCVVLRTSKLFCCCNLRCCALVRTCVRWHFTWIYMRALMIFMSTQIYLCSPLPEGHTQHTQRTCWYTMLIESTNKCYILCLLCNRPWKSDYSKITFYWWYNRLNAHPSAAAMRMSNRQTHGNHQVGGGLPSAPHAHITHPLIARNCF